MPRPPHSRADGSNDRDVQRSPQRQGEHVCRVDPIEPASQPGPRQRDQGGRLVAAATDDLDEPFGDRHGRRSKTLVLEAMDETTRGAFVQPGAPHHDTGNGSVRSRSQGSLARETQAKGSEASTGATHGGNVSAGCDAAVEPFVGPTVAAMHIAGTNVVVTGGGSGIGEALVEEFVRRRAGHVVVADLDAASAGAVAARIGGTAAELDVRDEAAIVDLVERTERDVGPIGIFVSNAGYVTVGGLEDTNERIQAMWEVHVMAHIYAARAVIPSMAAAGGGHLLNTASAAGLLAQIGSMAYTVTKHAAVALSEWLAITHRHQGIGVSVLCPQAVRTNILLNSPDRLDDGSDGAWDGGVAGGDGVLEAHEVARLACDAVETGTFLVLPHREVAEYVERKASDIERWLAGMRRLQSELADGGRLPGDALLGD